MAVAALLVEQALSRATHRHHQDHCRQETSCKFVHGWKVELKRCLEWEMNERDELREDFRCWSIKYSRNLLVYKILYHVFIHQVQVPGTSILKVLLFCCNNTHVPHVPRVPGYTWYRYRYSVPGTTRYQVYT